MKLPLNPRGMKYLDLTLSTPQENLACDEALLEFCEAGHADEVLRVWEPAEYFVVLGYASQIHLEVDLTACRARDVPVLRRCSGGGTVLQGPGCLNYSLILRIQPSGPLQGITTANRFIMERNQVALQSIIAAPIRIQGFTDLTLGELKFSGNAQRRKRNCLIFHGSFLLDFDIPLIAQVLRLPARQPRYRQNRSHKDFLTNLGIPSPEIKSALQKSWEATTPFFDAPSQRIQQLAKEKYSTAGWNFKF